jgi:hypothetical protein
LGLISGARRSVVGYNLLRRIAEDEIAEDIEWADAPTDGGGATHVGGSPTV